MKGLIFEKFENMNKFLKIFFFVVTEIVSYQGSVNVIMPEIYKDTAYWKCFTTKESTEVVEAIC